MSSAMPEFDPDLDLTQQISSYTENELKQLEKITLEILAHWEQMIKVCGAKMNEGTRMAIDLSMEQANKDLVIIRDRLVKVVKVNGGHLTITGPSSSASASDGQVSNSSSASVKGTNDNPQVDAGTA